MGKRVSEAGAWQRVPDFKVVASKAEVIKDIEMGVYPLCDVCGNAITQTSDLLVDPHLNVYHRKCWKEVLYEEKQKRRTGKRYWHG